MKITNRIKSAIAGFPGSQRFWENRYAKGGNSGAGSYGAIGQFKADTINQLVAQRGITSVIEFGCGDGHQLSMARYDRYIGLDVAPTAIRLCKRQFDGDDRKSFLIYDPDLYVNHGALTADMAMSLDVIEHLVEDDVLARYLEHMAGAATQLLVFFTEDQKPNPGPKHIRYRNVADWAPMLPGWKLTDTIDNPLKGPNTQADFFIFERA